MIGIYKITNITNGKAYIGQSVNIQRRWQKEKSQAFNECDPAYTYPLSCAFRKYGIENFTFEVLEECHEDDLNKNEVKWIAYYNTFEHGYNQTIGGDGTRIPPSDTILGIVNDLITTDMYHREIAAKWGVSTDTVHNINVGRYWKLDLEYPLQKTHKNPSVVAAIQRHGEQGAHKTCPNCGALIYRKNKLCKECNDIRIAQSSKCPTKEELVEKLHEYCGNCTHVGTFYNVSANTIKKWAQKYNISYHSEDYNNKPDDKEVIEFYSKTQSTMQTAKQFNMSKTSVCNLLKRNHVLANQNSLPIGVVMCDIHTHKPIQTFQSMLSAAKYLQSLGFTSVKSSRNSIANVCKGKAHSACGYFWTMVEPKE